MRDSEAVSELRSLIQLYNAQLAGAWPGSDVETLEKINHYCDGLCISVEHAFERYSL